MAEEQTITPVGPVPELPDGLEPPGAHAPTSPPTPPEPAPLPILAPTVSRSGPTPSELAAFDAETSRLIGLSMDKIDDGQKEFESLNSQAKAAKTLWQGLVEEQHKLIRERRETRGKPVQKTLLDYAARREEPPVAGMAPVPVPVAGDPLEHLWREFPIDRFTIWGMTDNDVKKLADGQRKNGGEPRPISTLGHLADFTANVGNPGFENRLTDFKGIGGAGGDRITTAVDRFWSWWQTGGRDEFASEKGVARAPEPGTGEVEPGPGDQSNGGEPGSPSAPGPDSEVETPAQAEDGPAVEPPGDGDEYSLTDAAA